MENNDKDKSNEDQCFFVIDSASRGNNSHFFKLWDMKHEDGPRVSEKLKG